MFFSTELKLEVELCLTIYLSKYVFIKWHYKKLFLKRDKLHIQSVII